MVSYSIYKLENRGVYLNDIRSIEAIYAIDSEHTRLVR